MRKKDIYGCKLPSGQDPLIRSNITHSEDHKKSPDNRGFHKNTPSTSIGHRNPPTVLLGSTRLILSGFSV
ncbi:MAG: hypothetical protein DRH37_02595 [Deltaproteobacteria bacterium]|nr:MAG: hypothetical protein DRH37_02595 [Deltaproteobacteria bacterium]